MAQPLAWLPATALALTLTSLPTMTLSSLFGPRQPVPPSVSVLPEECGRGQAARVGLGLGLRFEGLHGMAGVAMAA